MIEHLYDEDGLTLEAKLWYQDVCHGRIELLDEQREAFEHLRQCRCRDEFYESATEAYIVEFQLMQSYFAHMVQEIGED
jgi:hypothetical protein